MDGISALKNMVIENLTEVVNQYPWFGAAQKILCERVWGLGGAGLGRERYSDTAMHIPSREKISYLLRKEVVCSDEDIAELLKKYVNKTQPEAHDGEGGSANSSFRGVGDYFSVDQYRQLRQSGDDWYRSVGSDQGEGEPIDIASGLTMDFCTETLARIYAEQGYYDVAKEIYAKLILAYPEKNTYFAALIEKLNTRQ